MLGCGDALIHRPEGPCCLRCVILSEAEGSAVDFKAPYRGMIPLMEERRYFTYIVASQSRTLYIGITSNLRKRIHEHKWKEFDGFSSKYNCDRLVWFESYQEVETAIAREKQLKGWRREKKTALIERTNPTWVDLSREWYEIEPNDYKRAFDRMDN